MWKSAWNEPPLVGPGEHGPLVARDSNNKLFLPPVVLLDPQSAVVQHSTNRSARGRGEQLIDPLVIRHTCSVHIATMDHKPMSQHKWVFGL